MWASDGREGADDLLPDVDGVLFRCLMGSLVSGVSILTTLDTRGTPVGMTCSAVCSVSADPPLLLACIGTPSTTLDAIQASGWFVVNLLDAEADEISSLFASRSSDKFTGVTWRPGVIGVAGAGRDRRPDRARGPRKL